MNIKFPVCGEPVYLNSPLADIEFCRDLTVQQPFGGKADNFRSRVVRRPNRDFHSASSIGCSRLSQSF